MNELGDTSYDKVPYFSQAFAQSHPDRLAATAKLFGMAPARLDDCRVLELGCASGGNLIPMAVQLPGASFLGLDLSGRQIADGRAVVEQLHLANIELRQMDIVAVDQSIGKFDYIIAHGVYSWVPTEVQDKLLSICNENLAPNGVAYVSYNTYPGWRMRGMIRDMMVYHSKQFADAQQQVQQARALLDFLAQNVPVENNPYGILLKQEVELLRTQGDFYLAHDHLEDVNEPVYFHQFAQRSAAHGLQYLGEAEFHTMLASNFPAQVTETLRKIAPDMIRMEQYMDFLRNRIFRQTLLVHQGVPLNRNLDWRSMEGFYFASPARPVSTAPDLRSAAWEQFRAPGGANLNTSDAIVKAAMTILAERWPQAMLFEDLLAAARSRLDRDPIAAPGPVSGTRDVQVLGAEMLKCVAALLVELRVRSPGMVLDVGLHPKANPLARLQAEKGPKVTNLRHEPVNLDEFNRQLLQHLDGKRDRAALLEVMEQVVSRRELTIKKDGEAVEEPAAVREILRQALDQNLVQLAKVALLEG